MTEDRRNYDALLQAMADMKELILTRETACQKAVMSRLEEHDTSLKSLWKIVGRINLPAQIIGWVIIITLTGIFGVFGKRSGVWLWEHLFR